MRRLTERFGQNATTKEPCYIPAGIGKQEGNPLNEIVNKLGRLEDLADEGRLIELPCKVGSVLYRVVGEKICEYTVEDFFVGENGVYMYITHRFNGQNYYGSIHSEQFNRHYYLTKAEAEQKLAEMKGGGVDE